MAQTSTPATFSGIRRAGPLTLLAAGQSAFREVPRLRGFLVKGFLINYAVFIVLAAVVMGVLYQFVVQPLAAGIPELAPGEGFFSGLVQGTLTFVLWLTQALLMAASLLLSFIVSLALMGLWFEALVARIIAHFRGAGATEGGAFELKAWVGTLWRSLRDSVRLLLLSALSLVLGFVPVLGPFLVVGINSFLMGWEIREPYLVVREEMGDNRRTMLAGLGAWTAWVGLVPVILALIPWVGWVLLPASMIYLVAGVAWVSEEARAGRG